MRIVLIPACWGPAANQQAPVSRSRLVVQMSFQTQKKTASAAAASTATLGNVPQRVNILSAT
jgi:hypothetical protein